MTLRLDHLTRDQANLWDAAYTAGYTDGIAAGRAQVETEDADRWATMRATIHHLAQQPDYATLAERRGDRDRAARQRQILHERGIT